MFTVLPSQQSHCKSLRHLSDNTEECQAATDTQTKPISLGHELSCYLLSFSRS